MEKRKLLSLVLVVTILVTALVAGCSSSTATPAPTVAPTGTATVGPTGTATVAPTVTATATVPPAGKVIQLTLANQHPPTNGANAVVNPGWGKWIEQQSGGRIHITFYFASSASAPTDNFESAKNGIVDMSSQSVGSIQGRFLLTEATSLPLLFPFPGSMATGWVTDQLYLKYPEIRAQFEKEGVHIMGFDANGPAHVHTIKKPVHVMADLKGLILNASGEVGKLMRLLGATNESLLTTETYDALAKRVLDGNVLEWEGEQIWHFYEQVHYSAEVGLATSPRINTMNLNTWNKLPPDLQELMSQKNTMDYLLTMGWLFDNDDAKGRAFLESVYKSRGEPPIYVLPKEERDKWVAVAMPMRDDWVKRAASKGPAQAILDDAVKFEQDFRKLDVAPWGRALHTWGAPGEGTWWVSP